MRESSDYPGMVYRYSPEETRSMVIPACLQLLWATGITLLSGAGLALPLWLGSCVVFGAQPFTPFWAVTTLLGVALLFAMLD